MFARYLKKAPAATKPEIWVVRDSLTHNVLAQGTRETCEAFLAAFGMCYLERA